MGVFNLKSREEKFWEWFEKNANSIWNLNDDSSIIPSLARALNKYHPNLSWLMSPVHENGEREFIISADGISRYFPVARKLVERAPEIENWRFVALKPPIGLLEYTEYEDLKMLTSDVRFTFQKNDKFDLTLYIKDYRKNDKRFIGCVFILLDSLLGEVTVAKHIGNIDFRDAKESKSARNLNEVKDLKDIINNHINWRTYFR